MAAYDAIPGGSSNGGARSHAGSNQVRQSSSVSRQGGEGDGLAPIRVNFAQVDKNPTKDSTTEMRDESSHNLAVTEYPSEIYLG